MFPNVFPTLLRPDVFPPPIFGFHTWIDASRGPLRNPKAQASFLGHLWHLGVRKKLAKNPRHGGGFGVFSSPCLIHIFILLGGEFFPTRQDATAKYFDFFEFSVWSKIIHLHFSYH